MYDQDWINDGYIDGRPLKEQIECPKCGNRATRTVSIPTSVRVCFARGCGTEMVRRVKKTETQ